MMKWSKIDCGDGSQFCDYTEHQRILQFKQVNCMIHELPVHKGVTENNGKITAPTPTSCPCTCSDIYQVGDVSRKQSMLPSPSPPTLCVFLAAYDASCVCF